MVTKKKLDYGFSGYRVPIIPRAPRSIRSSQRRGPCKNLAEESKLCAFELLADVAGKLLLGSESSASSNVAEGKVQLGICRGGEPMDDKALKPESFNHGSCAESAFVPDISIPEHSLLSSFKGPRLENDSVLEHTSVLASSEVHKKLDCDINIGTCEGNNADRITTPKVGVSIYVCDSSKTEVGSGPVMHSKDDKNEMDNITMSNVYIVKDPIEECVNSNMLINSDSSVQLPLYRDSSRDALLQKCWNNVKLGIRDDDDNSYGCVKSSTASRPYRPHPRIGQRRIRKMLTSKYRKVAPKLKGRELYNNTRNGVMTYYQYRKRIYTRERCQQEPIKRRKLSNKIFAVAYNQETSSDSISNLHDKGMRIDKSSSTVILERGSDSLGTMKAHKKTTDPHVKFSIKSVKVPELYLEIPETATVGSLKRTVMEAVTAIFESGLRVGIVLQGKKVRDDNRTLQQAGISQSSNLDTLGFTLEPSLTDASQPMTTKKFPSILPCGTDQKLPRSPATPVTDSGISNATVGPPFVSKSDDDSNNNEFLSSPQTPINELMDGAVPNSKTLVPVLPMNVDAMAVVQVNPKSKRNELSHRRTRRPFSVAEVEGLVEAVETLGTGRWRDVKIGAFENADHRTYVDLKDKWKTLVHTATISPQQRRGEPVPQELLDRVLSAHSYWSQYQSKQQGKHLVETVDPQNESVEV